MYILYWSCFKELEFLVEYKCNRIGVGATYLSTLLIPHQCIENPQLLLSASGNSKHTWLPLEHTKLLQFHTSIHTQSYTPIKTYSHTIIMATEKHKHLVIIRCIWIIILNSCFNLNFPTHPYTQNTKQKQGSQCSSSPYASIEAAASGHFGGRRTWPHPPQ